MVSKKNFITFILIVVLVDAIFIVGLTFFVSKNRSSSDSEDNGLFHHISDVESGGELAEIDEPLVLNYDYEEIAAQQEISRLQQNNATDSWFSIYENMLPGTYNMEDGKTFEFLRNGYYNGYFNDANPYVSGYIYLLDNSDFIDGVSKVKIINSDASEELVYDLSFDTDGNIVIYNPDNGVSFVLAH